MEYRNFDIGSVIGKVADMGNQIPLQQQSVLSVMGDVKEPWD